MSLSTRDHPSPHLPTDSELVELAQRGDQQAFEKLYDRYIHRIRIYLSRMVGNDEVGDELAQETFFKVWNGLLGLRESARFANWLYRIATNVANDYQRRERNSHWLPWEEYKKIEHMQGLGSAGPEKQIEEAEILKQALARVSQTYRACLILYEVEGFSQREIAEKLKLKESCVSKYISRGKEQLRQIHDLLTEKHALQEKER